MYAVRVENMGVKFKLKHVKERTLRETIVRVFNRNGNDGTNGLPDKEIFWALRNVSFTVNEGESVGIIGHNGAGKSTLLQILGGIYKPDEGTVARRGLLGLLQLGTGFHPELTGKDNIYLSGAILGLRKNEIAELFDTIVEFSGLEQFIDLPIKNYSSGMISRLGFAIAVNVRPDILLIDEVLSVGDVNFREKCTKELEKIKAKGKTLIFVSHQMSAVSELCERSICLEKGQVIFEGASDEAAKFYLERVKSQNMRKSAK